MRRYASSTSLGTSSGTRLGTGSVHGPGHGICILLFVSLFIVWLGASIASAQTNRTDVFGPPSPEDNFGEHYKRAEVLYEAGNFSESILALRAAYAIRPLPRLLLNIGQLHLKLKQSREALDAYEAFLLMEPKINDEIRATVEEGMARARKLLEPAPKPAPVPANAPPPPPPVPVHKRWWFWTGLSVVALGTATGVALGVTQPWLPAEPRDILVHDFEFRPLILMSVSRGGR